MTSDTGAGDLRAVVTKGRFESIEAAYLVLWPVMRAIAAAVGDHCEVVLHDLSRRDLGHTIHAIVNGHVTGRAVGGPSTNLGLEVVRDEGAEHDEFGYVGRTADGRELHCSSVYYRDASGRVIAALCINVDLTPLQTAQNVLASLLPARAPAQPDREIHTPDIASLLDTMIGDAIAAVGRPVAMMGKGDRVAVLRALDARGAFHVKRSVETVAKRLGISRVTAYAYLDQLRSGEG
ncbi:transcriptional regulator [Promicromonospora thailandica]|uniref:Transcriptional regulator YheO, contains PAS and DNA-binding HTH domains n=1 Tax=Promicromonospora thailandica TaxID=765201 RepID=A0A9X2FY87_9MICO|nr:PAS domain-containing protein [Promicromonospora thailandica]MCP2262775.1 putative transcriptional regulator YheO, contains PAS and DNA-binding HTH domains [Promicromonospora thailandica]